MIRAHYLRKILTNYGALSFSIFLVFIISTDQYTKFLARKFLNNSECNSLFGDIVRLSLVENHGGFLGIVSNLPETMRFFLLNICVCCLLLICLIYLYLNKNRCVRHTLPLVFVTGGGISNLLDRLFHGGGVTDFVSLGIGSLRTGIFNLADVYILTGSFALGFVFFYFSTHSHDST